MIGVIILNYNTYRDVFTCIDSINKFTEIEYKIYVIDNASPNDSYKKILEKYKENKNVVVIHSLINGGYSAGNNIGISYAIRDGVDAIVIINSDVVLKNNALESMYQTLQSDENIYVVGPSIETPVEKEAQLVRRKLVYQDLLMGRKPFCCFKFIKNRLKREYEWKNLKGDIFRFRGMVSGCCFMIRTITLKECNFLDENVFLYYEEDILAYKLDNKGYDSAVNRKAKIYHNHSHSISKEGVAFQRYYLWSGAVYVLKKYAFSGYIKLLYLVISNILTWSIISIFNKKYRILLKSFLKKNIDFLKNENNLKN